MSNLHYDSERGFGVRHDDGTISTAPTIPFYVYSFLRLRWLPVCMRHKLIFKNDAAHQEHWTAVCEDYDYKECPASDYLFNIDRKKFKWSRHDSAQ